MNAYKAFPFACLGRKALEAPTSEKVRIMKQVLLRFARSAARRKMTAVTVCFVVLKQVGYESMESALSNILKELQQSYDAKSLGFLMGAMAVVPSPWGYTIFIAIGRDRPALIKHWLAAEKECRAAPRYEGACLPDYFLSWIDQLLTRPVVV